MGLLHRFWRDQRGTTVIEYVVIASIIVCAIVVSVQVIGVKTASRYSAVANNLT